MISLASILSPYSDLITAYEIECLPVRDDGLDITAHLTTHYLIEASTCQKIAHEVAIDLRCQVRRMIGEKFDQGFADELAIACVCEIHYVAA